MPDRALCWLTVAVALSGCHGGLCFDATWPPCPITNGGRVVKRGELHREVTALDLNSCMITTLHQNDLCYPKAERLDLRHNNIDSIEIGAFSFLISLKYLYLDGNRFLGKNLGSRIFHNCRRLLYIDFSFNDMSDTPAGLLYGMNNLENLKCDNCSLRKMPTFVTSLRLPIKSLSLDYNQLTRLDYPATFVNISHLTSLKLRFNTIDYLHEDLLKPLTEIKQIELSSNKIRRIPEELFQNMSHLSLINLAGNFIDYISEKAFLGTTNLKTLDLNDNRLVYLPENFFSKLHSSGVVLTSLSFASNRWSCACLNELLAELKRLNISYDNSMYDGDHKHCIVIDSFKCHRPNIYQDLYDKFITDGK